MPFCDGVSPTDRFNLAVFMSVNQAWAGRKKRKPLFEGLSVECAFRGNVLGRAQSLFAEGTTLSQALPSKSEPALAERAPEPPVRPFTRPSRLVGPKPVFAV